jgi:hypothetical protein
LNTFGRFGKIWKTFWEVLNNFEQRWTNLKNSGQFATFSQICEDFWTNEQFSEEGSGRKSSKLWTCGKIRLPELVEARFWSIRNFWQKYHPTKIWRLWRAPSNTYKQIFKCFFNKFGQSHILTSFACPLPLFQRGGRRQAGSRPPNPKTVNVSRGREKSKKSRRGLSQYTPTTKKTLDYVVETHRIFENVWKHPICVSLTFVFCKISKKKRKEKYQDIL